MKICIISPASHLGRYSSLGDAEMALTHLVIPDAGFEHSHYVRENYLKYFRRQSASKKWTILDNSAYEIGKLEESSASGKGLGPDLVLKAATLVKPSVVIAQDVLCEKDATLEATKDFIQYVKKKNLEGNFQIMAVAQGRTQDEWLESYEQLATLHGVDQIGFSKISVPLSFGGNQKVDGCVSTARLLATSLVDKLFGKGSTNPIAKPAHLLGGDNWLPWELNQQKKIPWVFSNDSSATVWYGGHKQVYNSEGKIDNIITQKPDLENLNIMTLDMMENYKDNIYQNIATLLKMAKD